MLLSLTPLAVLAAPTTVSPLSLLQPGRNASSPQGPPFCFGGKCWPTVHILGTQKGATTSLWDALTEGKLACGADLGTTPMAECATCNNKETHFFVSPRKADGSIMPLEGRDWEHMTMKWEDYISLFQEDRAIKRGCPVFMEATPAMQHVEVAHRMASFIPKFIQPAIKMVAILREPISRDLSWYNHQVDDYYSGIALGGKTGTPHGGLDKPLEYGKYVAAERHAFQACVAGAGGDAKKGAMQCHAPSGDPLSGLVWGMYGIQLMRFRTSWPRNQIFVVQMEQLIENTAPNMVHLFKFLGMDGLAPPPKSLPEANTHDSGKKVSSIPCSIRTALEEIFAPFNADLYLQLKGDKHRGDRPADEPDFPDFVCTVPCH